MATVTAADLTTREQEVVRLISLGCSTQEVATILGVSTATADTHRTNAMRKLGTRKAPILTRIAMRLGVTDMRDALTRSEKRKIRRNKKNADGWNC